MTSPSYPPPGGWTPAPVRPERRHLSYPQFLARAVTIAVLVPVAFVALAVVSLLPFIAIGLALGSGEFVFWPYITYRSGFVFFWACLLGVITQYFINLEIERWTLATGESAITGFCRLSRWWAPVMLLLNILPWIWPGWATGAGKLLSWLVLLASRLVAPVLALAAGVPGGLIDPAFTIGAVFGGGTLTLLGGDPQLGVALGMAAGLAGATQLPLMTTVFALRLAGDQQWLFGILLSAVLAAWVGRQIQPRPVYHALASLLDEQQRPREQERDKPAEKAPTKGPL